MAIIRSKFDKGLSTKFSKLNQPSGTYSDARNIIRDAQGTVKSEPGTVEVFTFDFLTNPTVLGRVTVDDTIILFIKSAEGSFIYNLTTESYILKTGYGTDLGGTYIKHDYLGFQNEIDVVARKNYKGEIIVYFTEEGQVPRRVNCSDSTITSINFDTKTALLTLPSLPYISDYTITESGSLPTGIYFFAARLVTSSGNKTTFSQISDPSPITNENESAGEVEYDGADPQSSSNKSIQLLVENIDTAYDYIEIAAITYTGSDNVLSTNIILKKEITVDTLTLTYYSEDQILETLIAEDLIEQATEYETAKHILQKDNFLFLSNLTTKDTSLVDDLMADVINDITIHYTVKSEVQDITSLLDSAEKVSSSGTVADWELDNTSATSSLRLKANAGGDFNNYKNPEYTTKYKGYQRDEVYSFALVPIFTGGITGFAYHIPGDNGGYTNISDIGSLGSSNTGDKRLRAWQNADGTCFHRMPDASTVPLMEVDAMTFEVSINILGIELRNINFPTTLTDILEGYIIVRQRRNRTNDGIIITQGIAKRLLKKSTGDLVFAPYAGKTKLVKHSGLLLDYSLNPKDDYDPNYFQFFSPDHINGVITDSQIKLGNRFKQTERRLLGKTAENGRSADLLQTFIDVNAFGIYYNTLRPINTGEGVSVNVGIPYGIDSSDTKIIKPFKSSTVSSIVLNDGKVIKSSGTTGGIIFKGSAGTIPIDIGIFVYDAAGTSQTYHQVASFNSHVLTEQVKYESSAIYTIYNLNESVYGALTDAEYIKVQEVFFRDSPSSIQAVYGGDTFLGRYNFNIIEEHEVPGAKTAANIDVWLETKGNYSYRHYTPSEVNGDTITEGTLPYAPKYKILRDADPATSGVLGIWDYDSSNGPSASYNKQYHFENTINTYYPKDAAVTPVTEFPNRTIYSLQSFEGEVADSYRIFLTNNYHDIPKETGEITNTFVYNNTLYIHTPYALWRTFVNEKTFVNTSTGQTVLGNGGLFPIPSQQVFTQVGGYAGSSSKYGCVNTPYGRVFIDNHQKLVFILIGNSDLQDISSQYMSTFFEDLSNTYNYQMGYDPLHKRIILSMEDQSISYSFELKSWSSFHDYTADKFSQRDNNLILAKDGLIHTIGTGLPNTFLNEVGVTSLELILNDVGEVTKCFKNIKWQQENRDAIFNSIQLSTENFDTGLVSPILVDSFISEQEFLSLGSQHVNLVNGEYRMTIPPDNVGTYDDEYFRPDIKGKYGILSLEYSDLVSPLVLQNLKTEVLKVTE